MSVIVVKSSIPCWPSSSEEEDREFWNASHLFSSVCSVGLNLGHCHWCKRRDPRPVCPPGSRTWLLPCSCVRIVDPQFEMGYRPRVLHAGTSVVEHVGRVWNRVHPPGWSLPSFCDPHTSQLQCEHFGQQFGYPAHRGWYLLASVGAPDSFGHGGNSRRRHGHCGWLDWWRGECSGGKAISVALNNLPINYRPKCSTSPSELWPTKSARLVMHPSTVIGSLSASSAWTTRRMWAAVSATPELLEVLWSLANSSLVPSPGETTALKLITRTCTRASPTTSPGYTRLSVLWSWVIEFILLGANRYAFKWPRILIISLKS